MVFLFIIFEEEILVVLTEMVMEKDLA